MIKLFDFDISVNYHCIMIININDNIQIEYTNNPLENMDGSNAALRSMLSHDYIIIQNRKFPVINPSELIRSRSKDDGYYRVIYIQINMATGEYVGYPD